MQALFFLSSRSFVNAVKRALTSGKRLFTLIFAMAYYGWLVFRPITGTYGGSSAPSTQLLRTSPEVVDVVIFGLFALMSLLLTLTLLAPRVGFRQADVDVLFATPVDPRAVMFFRMFRDYIWTLLSPFLIALFGGQASRVAAQTFIGGMHGDGPLAMRLAAVAWFLMALAWVSVSHGIGFFVNRSDMAADRNKRVIDVLAGFVIIGTLAFTLVHIVQAPSWETVRSVLESPVLRLTFFIATAASWMVTGGLNGDYLLVFLGIGILLSVSVAGILLAMSQIPFMYDQAAVRGFGAVERRMLQRNNDFYGLSAQRAREGKMKVGRISRWIGNMRVTGAATLIWKEVLLQLRTSPLLFLFFTAILVMMMAPVVFMDPETASSRTSAVGISLLFSQALGVLMLTMNSAISGYIELLKRVDFQKPLPFKPSGTVFWEVASKCIPNLVVSAFCACLVTVVRPVLWSYALASFELVVGLSLLVSATVFFVTIAFPDVGDASQRGFRGILILLGTLICGLPGFGVLFLFLQILHIGPVLSVIPATIINICAALAVSFLGGLLYDSYNPSE